MEELVLEPRLGGCRLFDLKPWAIKCPHRAEYGAGRTLCPCFPENGLHVHGLPEHLGEGIGAA